MIILYKIDIKHIIQNYSNQHSGKNSKCGHINSFRDDDIKYQFSIVELGADEVIYYKTENFEDVINDYDAVFDTVAGDTYERSFKVLKKGSGIIVSMLEQPNAELMNQYGVKAVFQFTQVNRERLTKLAEWVDQNNIKINVDKTFSLDEAAKALDYQKDVHPRGKVVLTVDYKAN